MDNIMTLKAEIFDLLRKQQTLQLQVQGFEKEKNDKLVELEAAEQSAASAVSDDAPVTSPRLAR